MVLAYIFTSKFKSDMGRKFWGEVGSFPGFRSVTIIAFNISLGSLKEEAALFKIESGMGVVGWSISGNTPLLGHLDQGLSQEEAILWLLEFPDQ